MTEEMIFEVALGKRDPAERSAYLDEACGADLGIRKRVEALLETHNKLGNFLERPAIVQLAQPSPADVTGPEQEPGEDNTLGFLQPSAKPGSLGRLAHYEVLEILGRGGYGTVLKAFDEKLQRLVAIKVMSAHLAATSPPRKRFLREARSAGAIGHENVVTIHAVEEQPVPYLVMEYIAGETLQQKLDRMGPFDTPEVLALGRQIASGLAAAHALGLIHRDIKPANILLENAVEPRVKITDFGLARAVDDASLTQSGFIAGTPLYMAPEQAQGETIDQRADLFSLGSVLYVMCTGRAPFRASTTLAVMKRVAEDTPRPMGEIIPEVPNWLSAIVSQLHAKKPADRFGSAAEVADLLTRHLAKLQQDRAQPQLPGVPPPASVSPPAVRESAEFISTASEELTAPAKSPWPMRWRWLAAAAVGSLLLAGLGLTEATGVTNLRGTVVRFFSPEGTLVVEVDDPGISVTIDGEELVITGTGVKEIRLKPGQYKMQLSKDGKMLRQEIVTVSRNGRQVVQVSKETDSEGLETAPENNAIASAGFNDARGLNSNRVPDSPYPLDSDGKQGGIGEPGWAGPWTALSSSRFSFQKKVVYEGDGALYMSNEGADRRLAEAQRGQFQVEMLVQVPEGGKLVCYLKKESDPLRDGPVWEVSGAKFYVMDGENKRDTGFTPQPRKWHKISLRVDVPRKEWQFFVDDQKFETMHLLRFRTTNESALDTIRLQCETEAGIYLDALRITRLPGAR
jgi:eukaryotic-like serine/threonine-protein kinase